MNKSKVFLERSPNEEEIEMLRLLLSTYQDGSGQNEGGSKPGWRDFERAATVAFGGIGGENKCFVDVIFDLTLESSTFYGIDCKMRGQLDALYKKGIYVEVTNASKEIWSYLNVNGVTEGNFRELPDLCGNSVIHAVENMKLSSAKAYPLGYIDKEQSFYLVLLYNDHGEYQLFQLPLTLPIPKDLQWKYRHSNRGKDGIPRASLVGSQNGRVLYEWYPQSGGQFKYYPTAEKAVWLSHRFSLEPLGDSIEQGLIAKAKAYFPNLWAKAIDEVL